MLIVGCLFSVAATTINDAGTWKKTEHEGLALGFRPKCCNETGPLEVTSASGANGETKIIVIGERCLDVYSAIWTCIRSCGLGRYRLYANRHRCHRKGDHQHPRDEPHKNSVSTLRVEGSNGRPGIAGNVRKIATHQSRIHERSNAHHQVSVRPVTCCVVAKA